MVAAMALVGTSCSSGDDGNAPRSTAAKTGASSGIGDDPAGFEFAASRRCTDLINGIDHGVATAGHRARLEFVFAAHEDDRPDDVLAAAWKDAMSARLRQLQAIRDEMASIEPTDDLADAWDTVVAAGDREIDLYEDRLALIDQEWAAIVASIVVDDGPSATEAAALDGALKTLRMSLRDCRGVYHSLGNPPEHSTFLTDASSACTTIVSRRIASNFGGGSEVLGAVTDVLEGRAVEVTAELVTAVDDAVTEWQQTVADLETVDASDVPDTDAWQQQIDLASDRVQGFERRASALDAGDAEALEEAFSPGVFRINTGVDWSALELGTRDCFAVTF